MTCLSTGIVDRNGGLRNSIFHARANLGPWQLGLKRPTPPHHPWIPAFAGMTMWMRR